MIDSDSFHSPPHPPDSNGTGTPTISHQACVACRKIKIRCLDNEDGVTPCRRCRRLDLDCEYVKTRRGRKPRLGPKSESQIEKENERRSRKASDQPESSSQAVKRARASLPRPSSGLGPSYYPESTYHIDSMYPNTSHNQLASASNFVRPSTERSTANSPVPFPPPNPYAIPTTSSSHSVLPVSAQSVSVSDRSLAPPHDSTRSFEMSGYLDPVIPSVPEHSPSAREKAERHRQQQTAEIELKHMFDDPIELGYITSGEADTLVNLFLTRLNPLIAILDTFLHDVAYLRSSDSLALFTAVLAVTAKFHRVELYNRLLDHAQTLLNRAITRGDASCNLIQALLVLVYFKSPTDRSAWLKIGIAIRMAYQLGWHVSKRRSLPENAHEARLVLDPERTWYCLICFDRQYADLFSLPEMTKRSECGDVETWAREHLHLGVEIDMHLACSLQMKTTTTTWKRLRKEHLVTPRDLLVVMLDNLDQQVIRHATKWFSPEPENQPGHSTMHRNLMCWFSCVMLLGVKYHHLTLVTGEEAEEMTLECLSRADRVISQLELVEMDGFLPYLYDAGTVGLSEWGIIVYQLYWRTPPAHRGFVLDLVHRANACCRRIAQGDNTAPPAFVGRFLERVIRLMNGQSRPHTRLPSPVPLNNHNGQERSVWQEGIAPGVNWALDDFINLTSGGEADEFKGLLDDQYWMSLFDQPVI